MNNELAEYRRKKHLEYIRKYRMPIFFKKWKQYINSKQRTVDGIEQFLIKNYFKKHDNISDIQYDNIPVLYRIKFTLTKNNLNKPSQYVDNTYDNFKSEPDTSYKAISSINRFPKYDNLEQEWNEYAMNNAIMESLTSINEESYNIENNENMSFQRALMLSLQDQMPKPKSKLISTTDKIHHVIIDLRVYGEDPHAPIYIDNAYYLNDQQIEKVVMKWKNVNPETSSGIYEQNLRYSITKTRDLAK